MSFLFLTCGIFMFFFKLSSHVGAQLRRITAPCTVAAGETENLNKFCNFEFEEFFSLTWRTSTWRCPFFVESCQQLRKRTFDKSEGEKFLWFARFVGTWLTLLRSPPPSWSAPGTSVPSSGQAASGSWCCCWTSQSQTSTVQRPQIKPKGKNCKYVETTEIWL